MNNLKSESVSMVFITCCMEHELVRRLPFAAFKCIKLQEQLAANGIQRDCGKLSVADATTINIINNYKLTITSDGKN